MRWQIILFILYPCCIQCNTVFLLLLHNVPIWNRGKYVSLARFTSPVPVIHTGHYLCTKRAFFHCRTLSRPIVYCNISLRPIGFFSLQTCYSKIVGNLYILRTTSSSCVPTRCIYLCFCKFMPFYTHGWCIEATNRDLTKTLIWQTDYLAI